VISPSDHHHSHSIIYKENKANLPEAMYAQYRDALQDDCGNNNNNNNNNINNSNAVDPMENTSLPADFLQDGATPVVEHSDQVGNVVGHLHSSSKRVRSTSRPKRSLSAFETYVRFEMMASPDGYKELSVEESEGHWKDWSVMPTWKREVYQGLAAADEIRYKKELQVWEDGKDSPTKIGDFFKARLFQKKVSSFQPSRSAKV